MQFMDLTQMKMRKKRLPFSSQMVNLGEINKTFMKSRALLILIFGSFLLVNCGGTKGEGSVGDVTVVRGELPEETESIDLFWRITGQPDASKLSMKDLVFNEVKSEMSFTPDAPGKFQFELEIFQYGDELETQKFTYTVDSIEPLVADASEKALSDESEDWLDEEYDEDLDDDLDDEYDFNELDSEDSLEYYETVNNDPVIEENNEKEEELMPLEIAERKETSSTPLPVKTQTTAAKPPVKKKRSRYVIPFDKSRFTIQVASKKNLNDAEKIAANLIESGYDAYIQKAYFRDTDEVWFRVRVGSYDNRDTALAVGKVIADAMSTEVWIDFVRFEE